MSDKPTGTATVDNKSSGFLKATTSTGKQLDSATSKKVSKSNLREVFCGSSSNTTSSTDLEPTARLAHVKPNRKGSRNDNITKPVSAVPSSIMNQKSSAPEDKSKEGAGFGDSSFQQLLDDDLGRPGSGNSDGFLGEKLHSLAAPPAGPSKSQQLKLSTDPTRPLSETNPHSQLSGQQEQGDSAGPSTGPARSPSGGDSKRD